MPELNWKIDLGHVITLAILMLGFAVQYGSLSTRLTVVESQAAKAVTTGENLNVTLMSLQNTIIRVETQMDERERRFDRAQATAILKEDQRDARRK